MQLHAAPWQWTLRCRWVIYCNVSSLSIDNLESTYVVEFKWIQPEAACRACRDDPWEWSQGLTFRNPERSWLRPFKIPISWCLMRYEIQQAHASLPRLCSPWGTKRRRVPFGSFLSSFPPTSAHFSLLASRSPLLTLPASLLLYTVFSALSSLLPHHLISLLGCLLSRSPIWDFPPAFLIVWPFSLPSLCWIRSNEGHWLRL